MIASFVLALVFSAQPAEIAIVYNEQTVIMPLANAQRLLTSSIAKNDPALKAALEIAFIAQPVQGSEAQLPYSDFHRERWQRQPLQCGGGAGFNNTVVCAKD